MSTQQRVLGSVSDLMAGLMMVFLFIAIAYMIQVKSAQESLADQAKEALVAKAAAETALRDAEASRNEAENSRKAAETARQAMESQKENSDRSRKAMADIADAYFTARDRLNEALEKEFDEDLAVWNAEIEGGTVRFLNPEILFATQSAAIKPAYRAILSDFFPRYLAILTSAEFAAEIEEVRIEGHTSEEWLGAANDEERYLKNAELSQQRAFSVLDHCFKLPESGPHRPWLVGTLRANGLSFARPVMIQGKVDPERSRRVEFRVVARTTDKIRKIIEADSQGDGK